MKQAKKILTKLAILAICLFPLTLQPLWATTPTSKQTKGANTMKIDALLQKLFPYQYQPWLQLLKTTDLLEEFPKEETDPIQLLDQLNALLQKRWLRRAGTERWHVTDDQLTDEKKALITEAFYQMGLYQAKKPTEKEYDCAFLLGAMQTRVESRLEDLLQHFEKSGVKFKRLYVLSGTRDLDPAKEPIAEELKAKGIPLNQTNMMEMVINKRIGSLDIPILYINAPRQTNAPRANTEDEMRGWIQRYGSDGEFSSVDKTILIVSNQPYVSYQGAVAAKVLSNGFDLDVQETSPSVFNISKDGKVHYRLDVIGHSGEPDVLSVGLDSLARQIYTQLPWLKKRALAEPKPIVHAFEASRAGGASGDPTANQEPTSQQAKRATFN